jgi:hypothetical protein
VSQILAARRCRGIEEMSMTTGWVEAEFEAIFREHYERIVRVTAGAASRLGGRRGLRGGLPPALPRWSKRGGHRIGWRMALSHGHPRLPRRSPRQQAPGLEEELDSDHCGYSEHQDGGPLTRLLRSERIAEVRAVLARLKLEKAQILLFRHSGLSYQEIAEAMQVSATSVGTMLARAEAEFSELYQQQQRSSRKASRLEAARRSCAASSRAEPKSFQ